MFDRNMTDNAQIIIKNHIAGQERQSLIALDATMGNGFDLEYLSLLPQIKSVWGFDVQPQAIENTKKRVEYSQKDIHLIQDSHHRLDRYIEGPIDIGMFNLGYLPQGDKTIVTTTDTTLLAIEKAIKKLSASGILTIMTYPGHEEGAKEHHEVEQLLSRFSQKEIKVLQLSMTNVNKPCPCIFVIIR